MIYIHFMTQPIDVRSTVELKMEGVCALLYSGCIYSAAEVMSDLGTLSTEEDLAAAVELLNNADVGKASEEEAAAFEEYFVPQLRVLFGEDVDVRTDATWYGGEEQRDKRFTVLVEPVPADFVDDNPGVEAWISCVDERVAEQ